MTSSELSEVKKLIVLTAAYYQRDIRPEVVAMMAEDLADLDLERVKKAFHIYRRNPKSRQMPLPAQIREIVEPEIDDDTLARDAAARIISAVSKYGWCNSPDARNYIGELGWSVVQKQGGWMQICESLGERNSGAYQAQFRDLAKAHLSLGRAGKLHQPPALPGSDGSVLQIAPTSQDKQRALSCMIKDLNEAIK